jgi:hypothetical protein
MSGTPFQPKIQRVELCQLGVHPLAIEPLGAFVRLPRVAGARQKLMKFTGLFPPVTVLRSERDDRYTVVGELASYVHACWLELHCDRAYVDIVIVERTRREIEDRLDLEILRAIEQGQYRGEADAFEALCEALSERAHHALFARKRPSARAKAHISGLPEEDFLHRPNPIAQLRIWDKICRASNPGRSNGRPS